MEFSPHSGQPSLASAPAPGRPAATGGKKARKNTYRLALTLVIIALAILAAGLGYKFMSGQSSEKSFLNEDRYQAVFLNGGQVYFGKINDMNSRFLVVEDIYYLRVNEQAAAGADAQAQQKQQDISLAKLGCELHGPEDEMVINREQVTFWENLKDNGQVAKAIAEFVKQNPDGQKCTEPAAS